MQILRIFTKSFSNPVCITFEMHQIGAKMIADVFEMNGWDSFFIGTGVPVKELMNFIDENKPDIIALSLTVYFNMDALIKTIEIIKLKYKNTSIIIGGQAFRFGGKEKINYPNTYIIENLQELKFFIKNFQ